MLHHSEKFEFINKNGEKLAARLDSPQGQPKALALFAHCFTCSKDSLAASRISRALTDHDVAVVRFDFTGLGHSEGDFSQSNFSSNMDDLLCAANHMRQYLQAPQLLIGHSLGGAAILAVANQVPEAQAVAVIAAPSEVNHLEHLFGDKISQIEKQGEAEVMLGQKQIVVRKQLLDDIRSIQIEEKIEKLGKALIIFHSPQDDIVSIDHARNIFVAAKHPKSFISLDKSDHLLGRKEDALYVANVISAWAQRYMEANGSAWISERQKNLKLGEVVVRSRGADKYTQDVITKDHYVVADEPQDIGGKNLGPNPYDYLLAALGACTSMTLQMYAEHKRLKLTQVEVYLQHEKIHAKDCQECETEEGKVDRIRRVLHIEGDLTSEQKQRMVEIANRCPVHRTLHSEILIKTNLDR